MKSSIAHKLLALVACLVGIPVYLYGCFLSLAWSMKHMWTQNNGWLHCLTTRHPHPQWKSCATVWTRDNLHWGTMLMIAILIVFTVSVISIVVNDD